MNVMFGFSKSLSSTIPTDLTTRVTVRSMLKKPTRLMNLRVLTIKLT
jgi:hypothetical protein